MTKLGVDTSVAIPLLVRTHRSHAEVVEWWDGREVALSGHALAETYSVLTRLPGDLRLTPPDAARLIAGRFADPRLLGRRASRRLPGVFSHLAIAGGAVHDALVALAAVENGAALATRDNGPERPTKSSARMPSLPRPPHREKTARDGAPSGDLARLPAGAHSHSATFAHGLRTEQPAARSGCRKSYGHIAKPALFISRINVSRYSDTTPARV